MAMNDNAYTKNTEGMITTTKTLVQLTQFPRLGARVAADAGGRSIPHAASPPESTLDYTSGSSRASSPTIGTTEQCNATTEGDAGTPHTLPLPPSPNSSVTHQTSMGEVSEAGAGEPATGLRQSRAAALRQRRLMKSLLNDDLL